MSEESKVTREDIAEQLQAGHRARLDGELLQNFNKDSVQFREVLPNRPNMPESYLNYASQLLEQMRGVYGSSWSSCSNGGSWNGGYNHFYDPCSGAGAAPSYGCPNYDCTNSCCSDPVPPPQPQIKTVATDCGCSTGGTKTYYDDCAYKLQKVCDQLNRIENMTKEMYMTNQQLASYLVEYYNAFTAANKSSSAK